MKTIDLRAYRSTPHAPAIVFVGVLLALILLNGLAEWQRPAAASVTTPTPGLIYVLSTREPPMQPTADPRLAEIDALKARLAELEAQRSVPAVYQEMSVQQQAAPAATPYIADPPIVTGPAGTTTKIEVPADAPRLCTGFGDWRDYDAMFQTSPVCHQAAP